MNFIDCCRSRCKRAKIEELDFSNGSVRSSVSYHGTDSGCLESFWMNDLSVFRIFHDEGDRTGSGISIDSVAPSTKFSLWTNIFNIS